MTYIIPRKNKTFVKEKHNKEFQHNIIEFFSIHASQDGLKPKTRPTTALNKNKKYLEIKTSRLSSPYNLRDLKDNILSRSLYNSDDKDFKDSNTIKNLVDNPNLKINLINTINNTTSPIKKIYESNLDPTSLKDLLSQKKLLETYDKLQLTKEITLNTKNIMKNHPLPKSMQNLNMKIKMKKTIGSGKILNFPDVNSEEVFEEDFGDRYRKKRINIEDVLVMHHSINRKDFNPLKTTEVHMKTSLNRPNTRKKIRPAFSSNCLNKNENENEILTLKREYLNSFEKHAVDPRNNN